MDAGQIGRDPLRRSGANRGTRVHGAVRLPRRGCRLLNIRSTATAAHAADLDVEVTHTSDGATVRLAGVFDAASVSVFSAGVAPLLYERRQPPVTIDVRLLDQLSGSGLGAIVFAVQFARGHGQTCRVTGARGQPAAILGTVALTREALAEDAVGSLN
jgi:anti-anti-sigma regulatory factor